MAPEAHSTQKAQQPPAAASPAARQLAGLPLLVATPIDVGRLIRELEALDEHLLQMQLQGSNGATGLPKTSQLLEETVALNHLNLLQTDDRRGLLALLKQVKQRAPVLHISFSADPQAAFIEKLMAWLRREIHPYVLMTIGLQPNIGAGCIVRSLNRQFDCSLRQNFVTKRQLLMEALAAFKDEKTA